MGTRGQIWRRENVILYLNTRGSVTDEDEILVDFDNDPGHFSHLEVTGPHWVSLAGPLRTPLSLSPAVRGAWGPRSRHQVLGSSQTARTPRMLLSISHRDPFVRAPRRAIPRVSLAGKPVLSS